MASRSSRKVTPSTATSSKTMRPKATQGKRIQSSSDEDSDSSSDFGHMGGGHYLVESIVDSKNVVEKSGKKGLHYLIKWKGYSAKENTWEPVENLTGCENKLKAFEEKRRTEAYKLPDLTPPFAAESSDSSSGTESSDYEEAREYNALVEAKRMMHDGVDLIWPKDKKPMSMVGTIIKDRTLCYVIKAETTPPIPDLRTENCVVVIGKAFRKQFPHLVIQYYEERVLFVTRSESQETTVRKMKRELEKYQEMQLPNFDVADEDMDEDGLPLPDHLRKGGQEKARQSDILDQFGLPNCCGVSDSSDDDAFEELSDFNSSSLPCAINNDSDSDESQICDGEPIIFSM